MRRVLFLPGHDLDLEVDLDRIDIPLAIVLVMAVVLEGFDPDRRTVCAVPRHLPVLALVIQPWMPHQRHRLLADRFAVGGFQRQGDIQSVARFLADWLESTAKPTLRPKTHHSYAQLIRLQIVPAIGMIQLVKLTPQHVQHMMRDMTDVGLSPRTVQYARAILRRALGYALKWGLVTRNVAMLVDPPRSVRKPVQPLTGDQARAFLAHVKQHDDRLWPFFTTAVLTGLRQGELLGLRWTDVDLDRATLRVSHTLQRIDGAWQFVEPKTRRSARTLSLPAAVVAALRIQKDRQGFEQRIAADLWQDWNLIFTTPKGTPFEPSNLNGRLHKLLDGAGLPRQGMHSLRHCCASLLLAQGIPARIVMEQLGHSQISMTMDTYSHVMPAMLRDAADALDSAMAVAE